MKKILLILFGIAASIVVFIAAIFTLTSGAAGVADSFFAQLKANQLTEAWALLSEEFQKTTNEEELHKTLASRGLADVTDTTWSSREISPGEAKISGSITNSSGDTQPVSVDLIKENGNWRIQYIGFDTPGLSKKSSGAPLTPPDEAEQLALVNESLTVFGNSINGKDFRPFVDHISETWRKTGVTVEQLNTAFASFIDQEINILPVLESLSPAFHNEVVVSENGILRISGTYPSEPSKLTFELDYIREATSWKVVRTAINLK